MVSRHKRHLSLFLVMAMVTSWFVVPIAATPAYAQSATGSTTTTTAASAGPPAVPPVYDKSFNPGTANIATSGFAAKTVNGKEYIVHRYNIPSQTPTIHEQWFELASDLLIVPGCKNPTDSSGKSRNTCDKTKATSYNYFQSVRLSTPVIVDPSLSSVTDLGAASYNDGSITETATPSGTTKVYRFVGPNGIADAKAPVLIRYTEGATDFTYGIFGVDVVKFDSSNGHKKDNGDLPGLIYNRLDGGRSPMTTTFGNNYIRYFNCVDPYKASNCEPQRNLLGPGGVTASTSDMYTLFRAWFTPDTVGEEASTLAKVKATITLENSNPVETPPFIKVAPTTGSRIPGVFVFKLTDVLTTDPQGDINTRNNYFLFQMTAESFATLKSTNAISAEIAALIDPTKVYMAVDLAGNVGLLISERKIGDKTFTIFNQEKRILDENVVTGVQGFDGDKLSNASKLTGMFIKPDIYQTVITKRVYNEQYLGDQTPPVPTTKDGNLCNTEQPVNYPETNKSYDTYAGGGYMEASGLPNKQHASCLNKAEGSWLAKWGTKVDRIEKSTNNNDACTDSFKNAFFVAKLLAGPMCYMLYVIVGSATWLAGFSVDFLIEAVGLQ